MEQDLPMLPRSTLLFQFLSKVRRRRSCYSCSRQLLESTFLCAPPVGPTLLLMDIVIRLHLLFNSALISWISKERLYQPCEGRGIRQRWAWRWVWLSAGPGWGWPPDLPARGHIQPRRGAGATPPTPPHPRTPHPAPQSLGLRHVRKPLWTPIAQF